MLLALDGARRPIIKQVDPMDYRTRAVTADEVVARIGDGQRIFVHGAAATPSPLLEALARRSELSGVRLYHLHLAGQLPFAEFSGPPGITSVSFFAGENVRGAIRDGRAEMIPVFLSDIPALFETRRIPLDVALVQLSPPDAHGDCTLGTSVDAALAAVESATIVLAEINERMPRTHGNTVVPLSRVTAFMHSDRALHSAPQAPPSSIDEQIADHVAPLVEHGATLQMGIGAIPDAVLARLSNKLELGVHTEMFSDGLIPLIENGVVTNRQKAIHRGRTVAAFVNGSEALFSFVHDNARVELHPCDRTNDTAAIRKNPKVTAINSALEVDLTGQVCADSIGHAIYSGIGGQMDFIRGAALSPGGKPIIAMPSTAARGAVSRITAALKPGAGVVTTRGHVHFVVTEHGVASLHGLTLRERAEALIAIAHPDFRSSLRAEVNAVRHFTLRPALSSED
jgi:4-hydroxybutyrate CoA-transferase